MKKVAFLLSLFFLLSLPVVAFAKKHVLFTWCNNTPYSLSWYYFDYSASKYSSIGNFRSLIPPSSGGDCPKITIGTTWYENGGPNWVKVGFQLHDASGAWRGRIDLEATLDGGLNDGGMPLMRSFYDSPDDNFRTKKLLNSTYAPGWHCPLVFKCSTKTAVPVTAVSMN